MLEPTLRVVFQKLHREQIVAVRKRAMATLALLVVLLAYDDDDDDDDDDEDDDDDDDDDNDDDDADRSVVFVFFCGRTMNKNSPND